MAGDPVESHDRPTAEVGSSTLVLATWQRPALLQQALTGVAAQTSPFDEILVAVRPDDVASREVIARTRGLPVREVLVHRPGLVAARNAALDMATGDICVFLDDDAVPSPDWHAQLVAHFETDPRIGAVGGRDRIHHDGQVKGGHRRSVGRVLPYGRCVGLHHLGTGDSRDVDFLKGVNMSFRRRALQDLRCDDSLRGEGAQRHEDTALSLAVKHAGFRVVYDPAIWVDHFEAQRSEGDQRTEASARAISERAFNQTYAIIRYLPAHRAVMHATYALGVGSWNEPGLLAFAYRLSRRDRVPAVGALRSALRARLDAIGSAHRARRQEKRGRR